MQNRFTCLLASLSLPCVLIAQWTQLGDQINGVHVNVVHQSPIALNANGQVAAIGSREYSADTPLAGRSEVVQWDGSTWNAMGSPHDGEDQNDWCGTVVSMNEAGTVYAVSCPGEFNSAGDKSGVVRVYEWNGSDWLLRGTPIEGPGNGAVTVDGPWPQFGQSLDMSSDGNILAVGAPHESEAASTLDQHGLVQIWMWDGQNWSQRGQDLRGTQNMDFGESVAISEDGNILAVGAPLFGSSTEDLGWAQSYEWIGEEWVLMGDPILGAVGSELLGMRLALSADGLTLAVACPNFGTPNAFGPGLVKVYDWEGMAWIQRGSTLSLDDNTAGFGLCLSMRADGNRLAVGATTASLEPIGLQQQGACLVYDWDGADWVAVGDPVWGEEPLEMAGGLSLSSDGQVMGIGSLSSFASDSRVRFFAYASPNDIEEQVSGHIELYPNPTANQLTIQSGSDLERIDIMDALGRPQRTFRPNGTTAVLNLTFLAPGIYILRCTSDYGRRAVTRRFVKN